MSESESQGSSSDISSEPKSESSKIETSRSSDAFASSASKANLLAAATSMITVAGDVSGFVSVTDV